MENIEALERRLWSAADQMRSNSKLTSSEYCMPLLGLIFLRHAWVLVFNNSSGSELGLAMV